MIGCALAVVAVYFAVASFVTDGSVITRRGRAAEVDFILRDMRRLDRDAMGDAPVTWIVGSSITRESFDAERIEARMQAAGSAHRVRKFAFNRGAPIFTQAVVDDLPLRPGDRVVTSIAEGNFRLRWLEEVGDFQTHAQALLSPWELLAIRDLALPTRLEWSLASTPPGEFFRNQSAFRRGLVKTIDWRLGLTKKPRIKRHMSYQPFTDTNNTLRRSSSEDWTLPPDEVQLAPGQTNYDGLSWLIEDLEGRGIALTVVYVPGHPWLYEEFVQDETVEAFQAHMDGWEGLDYARLAPRKGPAFMDWKHPNNRGRPGFSDELADLLLTREGMTPPPVEEDRWLARPDDAPAMPAVLFTREAPR